ncbi:sensor histidine kinase [Kitasatospora sp. P5_F3]
MGQRTITGRQALDVAAAVAFTVAGCVAGHEYQPYGWRQFDLAAVLLTLATAAPLAVRYRFPVPVLLASCLAFSYYLDAGYQPSMNWWAPLLALMGVCELRPLRVAVPALAVTVAVVVQDGWVAGLPVGVVVSQALLAPSVAALVGRAQRRTARRNAELRRLSAQLAWEQEDRARRAVVDERMRIARELHDVVAHHMAVISVQAGLAGVRAGYREEGRAGRLAPGVELCAYRAVQEALTNVAKHAGNATTEVTVSQAIGLLRVTVRNAGDGDRPATAAGRAGNGLIGMRERARICGGELRAGETGDGGFEVRLTLPVRAVPGRPES